VNLFPVEIIISNKPQARDPEGETIARDLIHKEGFQAIRSVRTGKLLSVAVEAENEEIACNQAVRMCNELRLFNPVAHSISVRVGRQN
jgi:phosphoribosylformylglycinamidine synthase PurS subunit